jgi:hypothetical protein
MRLGDYSLAQCGGIWPQIVEAIPGGCRRGYGKLMGEVGFAWQGISHRRNRTTPVCVNLKQASMKALGENTSDLRELPMIVVEGWSSTGGRLKLRRHADSNGSVIQDADRKAFEETMKPSITVSSQLS